MRNAAQGPRQETATLPSSRRQRPAQIIDFSQIGELGEAIGTRKVKKLLELACMELAKRPPAMRQLADANHIALLRAEAHGFKGAVASVGLISVARTAKAVELALPGAELFHSLDRLESEANRALAAVRSFIATGAILPEIAAAG